MRRSNPFLFFSLFLFLTIPCSSIAQTIFATFQGRVFDPNAAVLSGAVVTLENVETGWSRTLQSASNGTFQITLVPPGRYQLIGRQPGFADVIVQGLEASINQVVVYDLRFTTTAVAETVTVVRSEPLIESTRSDLGPVIGEDIVQNIPVDQRDFMNLGFLAPGTFPGRRFAGYDQVTEVAVAALTAGDNAVNLDGANINDPGLDYVSFVPLDSISEFQFLTNRYTAELAGSQGGSINLITRSGTNEFRASTFLFLMDDALNAESQLPFRRGQFGFTLGGAVKPNKIHYFVAYDAFRLNDTAIIDTGGTIPEEDGPIEAPTDDDGLMGKVDFQVSQNHHVAARYIYGNFRQENFFPAPQGTSESRIHTDFPRHSIVFSDSWSLSDRTQNELRVQYLHYSVSLDSNSSDPFEVRPSSLSGGVFIFPSRRTDERIQIINNFFHSIPTTSGAHSLKSGIDLQMLPVDIFGSQFARGSFFFETDEPFDPANPATYPVLSISGQFLRTERTSWQLGLYFNDDWMVSEKLTLNLASVMTWKRNP